MTDDWTLLFTKLAIQDSKLIESSGLDKKVQELLNILKKNPFQNPPPFEKLVGNLSGTYSRRINIKHRLVYAVFSEKKIVNIIRMWTHYEQR